MQPRPGTFVTTAGAFALIVCGGPLLASPVRGGEPIVTVNAGDTLSAIAERYGLSVERLAALNRLADPNRIFPGQRLRLGGAVASSTPATSGTASTVHVVRAGEHLTGIAARYGATIEGIVAANHLESANYIVPGQRLVIPVLQPTAPGSGPAAARAPATAATTGRHTVRAGETLTAIARHYGTDVATLVALNHLADASRIQAGQVLAVPVTAATARPWSTDRLDPAAQVLMDRRAGVRDLIVDEARRAGVPVPLALALAWQESGWRQQVVSSAGAVGVMQLLPDTADWIAATMLGRPVDLDSARHNVRAGVTLLKHYLVRYRGNRRKALAAYYQGQRAVDEHGVYPLSEPYVESILALEELLRP